MYNNLVDRCFRDCVDSFRRKDLDSGEEKVGLGCVAMRGKNRGGVEFVHALVLAGVL